ncbi:MAG: holo-[acyl-carrier-protein] synthase [Planctomycetes bacterium]|nr:holo-[acyl-carrier-protein] synthase [Planctomycetota bacterium]
MRIVSHGVDIIECHRIADLLDKHRDRFLDRVLTASERERADSLHSPIPHIAGRFASKEAILKVLGTGWRGGIAWTDIEISNDKWGAPHVTLSGMCKQVADELGIDRVMLSISHSETVAMASALGVGKD